MLTRRGPFFVLSYIVQRSRKGRMWCRQTMHAKRAASLRDLVAADRAEYGKSLGRKRRSVPDWAPAEERVVKRYARAVLRREYRDAVLAVEPCRAELVRAAKGARTALRTRKSVHHRLVAWAIQLGRVRLNVPWTPREEAELDRFVRAVSQRPDAVGA